MYIPDEIKILNVSIRSQLIGAYDKRHYTNSEIDTIYHSANDGYNRTEIAMFCHI